MLLGSAYAFSQDNVKVKKDDIATDFELKLIDGSEVQLSKLYSKNPVVLVILRGWPEYQCPVCSRQVGQFIDEADRFREFGATILMVYPGPSAVLQEKAKEFADDFTFPDNFYFAIDPGYTMINKYKLRWDAPKETTYPSTFVINKKGKVLYSKVSLTHGGRASVDEVITALEKL